MSGAAVGAEALGMPSAARAPWNSDGPFPDVDDLSLTTLASSPRWVAWQVQDRKGGRTKIPHNPNADSWAESNNPFTWGTRAEAEDKASRLPMPYGVGGVGIMLGHARPWCALGGIDLDACLADGAMAPWAQTVVDRFGTYGEVSPSGTGAKLFFAYSPSDLPRLKKLAGATGTDWTGKKWSTKTGGDHPPAIEVYFRNRFFAVTDKPIPDSPMALRVIPFEVLEWLIRDHGPNAFPKAKDSGTKNTGNANRDGSR